MWNATIGFSCRRQGGAYSRVLAEEVETTYGADLEAFVEKRFGDSWSVRLTGTNLLNATKDETFHKFDTLADQIDRDYDEYELESEESGTGIPVGRTMRVLMKCRRSFDRMRERETGNGATGAVFRFSVRTPDQGAALVATIGAGAPSARL